MIIKQPPKLPPSICSGLILVCISHVSQFPILHGYSCSIHVHHLSVIIICILVHEIACMLLMSELEFFFNLEAFYKYNNSCTASDKVHKQVTNVNAISHATYGYMNCHDYNMLWSCLLFTCIYIIQYKQMCAFTAQKHLHECDDRYLAV